MPNSKYVINRYRAKRQKLIDGVIHWECRGCMKWKPLDGYHGNLANGRCKECNNSKAKHRYARKSPAEILEIIKQQNAQT